MSVNDIDMPDVTVAEYVRMLEQAAALVVESDVVQPCVTLALRPLQREPSCGGRFPCNYFVGDPSLLNRSNTAVTSISVAVALTHRVILSRTWLMTVWSGFGPRYCLCVNR